MLLTMSTNKDLLDKLGDDARWEKNERKRLDDLDALDAIESAGKDEEAEAEADVDDLARRDSERPSGFSFADACAILGYSMPRPDLAEARQTAGVRCKDLR